ncbi:MAG TPA: hypothetical protein VLH79_13445 [Chthonomonadales bacterium]|nr:hypothetical protein [Chthonomonadales bacterium]
MSSSGPRPGSEETFSRYLDALGLRWEYEPLIGSRRPDFGIADPNGRLQAVVEIEDIEGPPGFAYGKLLRLDIYGPVREKINSARKHFQRAKHLPCMLVLQPSTLGVQLLDDAILGAMLGNVMIEVPLGPTGDPVKNGAIRTVFGPGGKMLNPKDRTPQNTTVSAVAVMELVAGEALRSGCRRKVDEIFAATGTGDQGSTVPALESGQALETSFARKGIDLDARVPRLRLFHNPYARIRWPDGLVGDLDDVWDVDRDRGVIYMARDGQAPYRGPHA